MNHVLQKRISIKILHLVVWGCIVLGCICVYYVLYLSDYVPSLDCMSINRGYLRYVQDKYSSDPDFDRTIWPNAIEVGGKINSLCYESITGGGLLKKVE